MLVNEQLLAGRVVYSPHAHAKIISFDLTEAKKVSGVHAVLCYKDIPGHNQMGPVVKDEFCLAEDEVVCVGQAIFLIAAEREEQCIEAEKLIKVKYESLEPILTIEKAIEKYSLLGPPATIARGNVGEALKNAPHIIEGQLETGAQEHWYLESQVCLCVPGEGKEIERLQLNTASFGNAGAHRGGPWCGGNMKLSLKCGEWGERSAARRRRGTTRLAGPRC